MAGLLDFLGNGGPSGGLLDGLPAWLTASQPNPGGDPVPDWFTQIKQRLDNGQGLVTMPGQFPQMRNPPGVPNTAMPGPQGGDGPGLPPNAQPAMQPPQGAPQMPQQPQMQPGQMPPQFQNGPPMVQGGMGERALGALNGFTHGRGLLPAITNAITTMATGRVTDPVEYGRQTQQQNQEALYKALLPTVGHNAAMAAAMNPDAAKVIMPDAFDKSFKVIPWGATAVDRHGKVVFQNDSGEQLLDDKSLSAMAEQYRSGDTSVMQNLGRGAQGAANIVALRKKITEQNSGQGASGTDQAMRNAEFFGVKSGQRTLGTKQANIEMAATEFKQVLPIVAEASKGVDRTKYPDLNKIIQAFEEKTGDPNIVRFGGGVNTLVNLYARAISPGGVATVSDKDHARILLNKAWSQGQFEAAVGMMTQEIEAALKSPEVVRDEMRRRFSIPAPTAAAPAHAPTMPGGSSGLQGGWTYNGTR